VAGKKEPSMQPSPKRSKREGSAAANPGKMSNMTTGKALEESLTVSWNDFKTNHPEVAAAYEISQEEEDRFMAELVEIAKRQTLISAEETPCVNTSSHFDTTKSIHINFNLALLHLE